MIRPSRQAVTNPYLGPRTFTYADREFFFGRDREARHLLARIPATRIMLFYAPSGAGKSSLLNTRIIPGLRDEPYNRAVLPIGRIGGESPASLDHVDNSYVFNLLASLDQGAGDPSRLAHLTLKDFLAGFGSDYGLNWRYDPDRAVGYPVWADSPHPYVLVIDQFEDIIAGHPGPSRERDEFFRQLADALLADARLSVTLALRVEYLGAIDPYIRRMPDWLIGRFYMDRLSMDAALEAVQYPAQVAGRPFAPGVAEALVKDMSRARAGPEEAGGEYVEPMHLQALCYQLWQGLAPRPPGETGQITFDDLKNAGNVDTALISVYDTAVQRVAQTPGLSVTEPEVRQWFAAQLIAPDGTRSEVLRGEQQTGGMPNATVDSLQSQFLLRTALRADGEWVSLSHDRFVDLIPRANLAAQTALAKGAERELVVPTAVARRGHRRLWLLLGGLCAVAVLLLLYFAPWQHKHSPRNIAFSSDGKTLASGMDDRTIILWDVSNPSQPRTRGQPLRGHLGTVFGIAFRPDGKILASGSCDKEYTGGDTPQCEIILWDLSNPQQPRALGQPVRGHSDLIYSIAFSPDGKILASASWDRTVILWDVSSPQQPHSIGQPLKGHRDRVLGVTFSPDGKTLASASSDTIILWEVSNPQRPYPIGEPINNSSRGFSNVAFSPDGKTLASGSSDKTSILWDVSNPQRPYPIGEPLQGHSVSVWSVAFSPDGKTLASASSDTIILWDVSNPQQPHPLGQPLKGHSDRVWSVAFSPDGKTLASASLDGTIILWDVSNPQQPRPIGQPLKGLSTSLIDVAFSPDGKTVVSAATVTNEVEPHVPNSFSKSASVHW